MSDGVGTVSIRGTTLGIMIRGIIIHGIIIRGIMTHGLGTDHGVTVHGVGAGIAHGMALLGAGIVLLGVGAVVVGILPLVDMNIQEGLQLAVEPAEQMGYHQVDVHLREIPM